jgi:putative ABC transport system substrate-binding protein
MTVGVFVVIAALGYVALIGPADAQSVAPPRIAVVLSTADSRRPAALQEGLRPLGYVEGRNITIDARSWAGVSRPLADLAAEVVASRPAVIVTEGNPAILALKQATASRPIPIVMAVVGDPVGSGFIASLSRPGGNITGLTNTAEQLSGKRIELLKELVPGLTRVAVLQNPTNATHPILLRETQVAAQAMGIAVTTFDLRGESDVAKVFDAIARDRIRAVVALPQAMIVPLSRLIAEAAAHHRLPMMYHTSEPVQAGGLVSYGPSATDLWQRTAGYVDRILKGARPADLPVEQPTRFDLVVNIRTARALALTVPPSMLLRAQEVIE